MYSQNHQGTVQFWIYLYPLVTPTAMFVIWLQIVLTQAKSLRLPNHFSTLTVSGDIFFNSILRWLKFRFKTPLSPRTVTSLPFTHIFTPAGTVTSWLELIFFISGAKTEPSEEQPVGKGRNQRVKM